MSNFQIRKCDLNSFQFIFNVIKHEVECSLKALPSSAGAIGLPWAFREHDNFSTDFYILDHANFFQTARQFFRQCLLPFLCKLVMTS